MTNASVLKEIGTELSLLKMINNRKLKYVGHALRNPRTSLMKTVYEGKLEGKRNRGRPPMSIITNLTQTSGMSLHGITTCCQDREMWRKKVRSLSTAANIISGDADR